MEGVYLQHRISVEPFRLDVVIVAPIEVKNTSVDLYKVIKVGVATHVGEGRVCIGQASPISRGEGPNAPILWGIPEIFRLYLFV